MTLLITVGLLSFLLGVVTTMAVFVLGWWIPAFRRHDAEIKAAHADLDARIKSGCRQRVTRWEL